MAFHEGVPGHHLQLAIAAELPDSMPEFRKHLNNSAYSEGWGLYTERLSDEMGLYSAAVDRMGMYSADSMRACRLVVDTGIHALGWSRQQAIDYMVANSPLTEGVCRPEIDRYICRPGQATSYMIGRLEIQRMRREAEQRQGERFDVRRSTPPCSTAAPCRSACSTGSSARLPGAHRPTRRGPRREPRSDRAARGAAGPRRPAARLAAARRARRRTAGSGPTARLEQEVGQAGVAHQHRAVEVRRDDLALLHSLERPVPVADTGDHAAEGTGRPVTSVAVPRWFS